MAQKEAKARLKINMLLSDAGWRLLDNEDGPANVDVENKVDKISKTWAMILKIRDEGLSITFF